MGRSFIHCRNFIIPALIVSVYDYVVFLPQMPQDSGAVPFHLPFAFRRCRVVVAVGLVFATLYGVRPMAIGADIAYKDFHFVKFRSIVSKITKVQYLFPCSIQLPSVCNTL